MRQPTLVLAATSLMILAPLVGCDEQSHIDAQRHIDDAVSDLERAQLGFVPGDTETSLAEHRLETLGYVSDDLDRAIAEGDRDQQVMARRLLADVHAAATRALLRDAGREDAALRRREASIITQLAAYERAHARVVRFDRDNAMTLEQINEEIREQRASREAAQEQRAALESELEQLREQRQTLRQQIDAAQAEARRLRDEAFVAEGDQRYELEEQADQVLLRAAQQGAEAERVAGEIALAEADLSLVNRRIETIDELVADLQSQVETVEQQTAQTSEWHSAAQADRAEAFEALSQEYERLLTAYNEAVRSRYAEAYEMATQAATEAGQAASAAAGPARGTAQLELLARQGDQIRVLVHHAEAIGALGRVLGLIAERLEAAEPDAVRPFQERLAELTERQETLVAQAEQIIGAATETATALSNGGGDVASAAAARQEWLTQQQNRLRSSRLTE